jgi:hypothetical protein
MVNSMDVLKRDLGDKIASGPAQAWWAARTGLSPAVLTEGGKPTAALPAPDEREVEQPAGSPASAWMTITSPIASFFAKWE